MHTNRRWKKRSEIVCFLYDCKGALVKELVAATLLEVAMMTGLFAKRIGDLDGWKWKFFRRFTWEEDIENDPSRSRDLTSLARDLKAIVG